MASPSFSVLQVTGPGREIVLRGRALPLRGAAWESEMAVETTWYTGNPVANTQVIGFREMPSVFNGRWSDKLLGGASLTEGVTLINFPPVTPVGIPTTAINAGSAFAAPNAFPIPTQRAQLAATVHEAFDLVMREGQKLRVQWGTRVRFGYLVRMRDAPGRSTDIEWELEFKWSGRVDTLPLRIAPQVNLLSTGAGLQKLLDGLQGYMPGQLPDPTNFGSLLAALLKGSQFLASLGAKIANLVNVIAGLLNTIEGIANLRFAPQNLLNTIKAALQLIRSMVADLLRDLANGQSASQEAAAIGLPDAVAIARMAQAQLRKQLTELAAFALEQQRLIEGIETSDVLATYVTSTTTTLLDVSSQFYGTPNNWVKIAQFNRLAGSTVPAGTPLLVPKLS
ncbi:MAG: hypothetical protein M0R28_17790 [Pigmentiphaga sp.]|nr:hypothetical protein [Pigmentiphaga sp.]